MIKRYYELTKPGLVWGNLITTLAGLLFASRFNPPFLILFATLAGTAFVIASACVFNNIFDREADKKMPRTNKRALATGVISVVAATWYGSSLSLVGFGLLFSFAGFVPGAVALFAFIIYVRLYTPLKYRSPVAVFVGALAGAAPVVIGYTAISQQLDFLALILFLIMVLWQMPHFYSIALFRRTDYAAAGIPVLSIQKGERTTYRHILAYILLYIIVASSLTFFGYAGLSYLAVVATMGGIWLGVALGTSRVPEDVRGARRVFFVSLAVMISFSIALSVGNIFP